MDDFCLESKKEFLEDHHHYAQTKLVHVPNIIIFLNSRLSLLKRREEENSGYDLIKTMPTPAMEKTHQVIKIISHGAVQLYMILEAFCHGEIPPGLVATKTQRLRNCFMALKHLYSKETESLLPIIDLTLNCIDKANRCFNAEQLHMAYQKYMEDMASHHEAMGREASELQLKGLQTILLTWMDLIDLSQTYIIIACPRGPRQDLIEHQYFARLRRNNGLESNTSTNGIIYAEMLPAQLSHTTFSMLINDLGAYLANQDIGKALLGDREAMNKDILAKHARPVLDSMLPSKSWKPDFWQTKPKDSTARCPLHQSAQL